MSIKKKKFESISGAARVGAGVILLLVFVLGLNWVFSNLRQSSPGGERKEISILAPIPKETLAAVQPTPISSDSPGPLAEFPLSVGTRWVYSSQQYEQAGSDPNQIITATAYITETIVSTKQVGILFLAQVDRSRHFTNIPAGWPESPTPDFTSFWYVVADQKVYESPNPPESTQNYTDTLPLQYDFPFSLGKSWCPLLVDLKDPNHRKITDCTAAGKQIVKEQGVYATPAGKYKNCSYIVQDFNSRGLNQWFCNGVGMVASEYDHGGTRFGSRQILIRYHPGTPTLVSELPTPTLAPTREAVKTKLTTDQLKNMVYCQPTHCWADMKDGKFGNGDKSGELIEPVAFGDLNGDGWEDAAVLIQEKHFGMSNYDLIAVLNKNGQPGETFEKTLPDDATVESLRIENGQIVVDITTSSTTHDPESTLARITQTYVLAGQTLVQVRWASQTQDGKTHTLKLEQPAGAVITSNLLTIQGKLNSPHPNLKLVYNLYDQSGNQVYNAESSATVTETGDFSLPVDLAWVEPGKLRLEVDDLYSTPNLAADLAIDSVNIDYQPAVSATPPALFSYFKMVDEKTGWAQSADTNDLMHTRDGGLTWQKSGLPYKGPFSIDILNSTTAWLLSQAPNLPQQFLYHTGDGGQTWNKLPDLPVFPSQFASITFLDANHGFFVDHPGGYAMMGQTRFLLYKTQDGGQTWEKVFDNNPGGAQENQEPTHGRMVFRDMQNGWTVDSVIGKTVTNSLYLMRTHDGGGTWTDVSQSLTVPDVLPNTFLSQMDLKFFGADQAVMPLLILPPNGGPASVRLYVSKDGGESWSLAAPVEVKSTNPTIDIISADDVMVWDGVSELITTDGGATWVSQPVSINFPGILSGVQFVSPSVGFALVNDHNPNAQNTNLYKTTDGGKTWQKIEVR